MLCVTLWVRVSDVVYDGLSVAETDEHTDADMDAESVPLVDPVRDTVDDALDVRHSDTVGDCVFDVDGDTETEYDAEPERDTDTLAVNDAKDAVDETLGLIDVEYVTLGDGDSDGETVDDGHIVYVPVTEKESEFVIVPLPDQDTVPEPDGLAKPEVVTDSVPVIEFVADTVEDCDDV